MIHFIAHNFVRFHLQAKEVFEEHNFKEGVVETSGKLVIFLEILNNSLSKGDKVLVFRLALS